MVPELWSKLLWERVRPYLDPWGSVRLRTASTHWNVPGKYGPHGELIFFLIKKEQVVASNEVLPNPCVSAETLEACALIGLHLMAADHEVGSSGSQSLDLGEDTVIQKALTGMATLGHGALRTQRGKRCSESFGALLEDWNLRWVALSCHIAWIGCARKCMRPGSWVVAKRPSVTARKNSSRRGRAVTKEKGWGERNSSKEESGTGLCGLGGLVGILLLRIFVVV